MRHFLDKDFNSSYLELVYSIKSEEYYVNMMKAWFFATALAKQYDATLPIIQNKKLDIWTHNKAIQKAQCHLWMPVQHRHPPLSGNGSRNAPRRASGYLTGNGVPESCQIQVWGQNHECGHGAWYWALRRKHRAPCPLHLFPVRCGHRSASDPHAPLWSGGMRRLPHRKLCIDLHRCVRRLSIGMCHSEPVLTLAWESPTELWASSKYEEIATPVCGLVRNDKRN